MRYMIRLLTLLLAGGITPAVAAAECRPGIYGTGPEAFVVLGRAGAGSCIGPTLPVPRRAAWKHGRIRFAGYMRR